VAPAGAQSRVAPAIGSRGYNRVLVLSETLPSSSEAAVLAPASAPCSYRDLEKQRTETFGFLRRQGFGRQTCVAVVSPPGAELGTMFLAVASACRCAPLNPSLLASEIAFVLRDTRAQALIAGDGTPESVVNAAREAGVRVFIAARNRTRAGDWTFSSTLAASEPSHDGPPLPDDIALYLHTSGTTARAKLVPILQSAIANSALSIARSLELHARDRSLCIMPLFHVHGLVAGFLAPLVSGGSVWCAPGFQAARFFQWLRESRATWYTAVPAMHRTILLRSRHHADMLRSHGLRFIRSCSAPLPEVVWRELQSAFGVPIVQAYGMTEAAHQISSTSLAGETDEMGSVGKSTGPAIAILDQEGNLHTGGIKGEVVLKGASLIRHYESPLEANSTAFHGDWFRTGDEGYVDCGGNLRLTGRLKELINSGGEKISPYEVEEVLLSHAAVHEAVVFPVPHPLLGEAVAAAVVLDPETEATGAALRSWLRDRLAPHKVPKHIEVVGQLPRGSSGKLQRIGMAAKLGL
jgi:acyl-CoA synthetase (AMP-forming)/AMP-acid ligase II